MTPETLRRFAKRLNGGATRGSAAALAYTMGVPVKTARAWMLDPSEFNHRKMSRPARRLLALLSLLDAAGHLSDRLLSAIDETEFLLRQNSGTLSNVASAPQADISYQEGNEDGAVGINLLEGKRGWRGSETKQLKGQGMKEESERLEIISAVATNLLVKHGAVHECPNHAGVFLNTDNADFVKKAKREGRQMAFKQELEASQKEITIAIDEIIRDCQTDCAQCEEDDPES